MASNAGGRMKMRERTERTISVLGLECANALFMKAGRHSNIPDRAILNDVGEHYLQLADEGDINPPGYVRQLINATLGNRSKRRRQRGVYSRPRAWQPEMHAAH